MVSWIQTIPESVNDNFIVYVIGFATLVVYDSQCSSFLLHFVAKVRVSSICCGKAVCSGADVAI